MSGWYSHIPGGKLYQTSIGASNLYVGVASNNTFWKWTPSNPSWVHESIYGLPIKHASIGSDGTTWVVTTSQTIYRKNSTGAWELVGGGNCIHIDIADSSHIICVD